MVAEPDNQPSDPQLDDRTRPLFTRTCAEFVGNRRGLTERELQRAQPVAQRAGVVVTQFGGGSGHETGEGIDEHSRFGEIRLDVFGQSDLDGGGAHEVNGDPLQHFDRGHFGDVESGFVVGIGGVGHGGLSRRDAQSRGYCYSYGGFGVTRTRKWRNPT